MRIQEAFDMRGRSAIVTGGGTHLGRAMATSLAELGASVVIASRREQLCLQVAEELRGEGLDVKGRGCDVTVEEQVDALVNSVVESVGRLDVMVCNAGGGAAPATHVPNGSVDEFTATLELNVKGTYLSAQAAARVMVRQRSGSIITVGSIHGSLTTDKRFYEGLPTRHRRAPSSISPATLQASLASTAFERTASARARFPGRTRDRSSCGGAPTTFR